MPVYKITYKQMEYRSVIVDADDFNSAEQMYADAACWSKEHNPRWWNSDTNDGVMDLDPEYSIDDIELLNTHTTPTPTGEMQ
jgi:hypothetical protein